MIVAAIVAGSKISNPVFSKISDSVGVMVSVFSAILSLSLSLANIDVADIVAADAVVVLSTSGTKLTKSPDEMEVVNGVILGIIGMGSIGNVGVPVDLPVKIVADGGGAPVNIAATSSVASDAVVVLTIALLIASTSITGTNPLKPPNGLDAIVDGVALGIRSPEKAANGFEGADFSGIIVLIMLSFVSVTIIGVLIRKSKKKQR